MKKVLFKGGVIALLVLGASPMKANQVPTVDGLIEKLTRDMAFTGFDDDDDEDEDEVDEDSGLFGIEDLSERRAEALVLKERLSERVYGQERAVKLTADAILRYFAGINDPERPIANFLYLGPTGVGKTELAKVLAEELYGDRRKMLRLDMAEYSVKETAWRLLGSPPGYHDHQKGGALTNYIRKNPYSIILLDEIEKAHPQVHKLFLSVLDEGRIKDNRERWVDCTNCVFIMTSNMCSRNILQLDAVGLSSDEIVAEVEHDLMDALSPELYNRVEPVVFKGLKPEIMDRLVGKCLDELAETVQKNCGIALTFDDAVIAYLIENGFSAELGARPLKRLIERELITALAYEIIASDYRGGESLRMIYSDGLFSVVSAEG